MLALCTVRSFIKHKLPAKETHQTGACWNNQSWRTPIKQASNQNPALNDADESLTFFSPPFSFFYIYVENILTWMWECLNCLNVACTISPSTGYFGVLVKVWLTPGRNPLAIAIYREDTQSHLHLELMGEGRGEEWRKQSLFWHNLSFSVKVPSFK